MVTGAGEDIGAAACFDRRCLVGLGLCAAEASAGVAPAFTAAGVPVVAASDFLCLWCLSGLGDGEASGVVDCAKVLAAKAATINVMMRERISTILARSISACNPLGRITIASVSEIFR